MNQTEIKELVHNLYWEVDKNCATVMITALSRHYGFPVSPQVFEAIVGMHGAGGFGAQCGLVEGALLFIGMFGAKQSKTEQDIIAICYRFGEAFTQEFGSLICSVLRPQGFNPDNPPHLCEEMTNKAVLFAIQFVKNEML